MTEPANPSGGKPTPPPGHETRDVDPRKITLLAAVLVAVVAVCLVLTLWLFDFFASRADREQPPVSPLARGADQRPPEPRLQEVPMKDIREMRAEEEVVLKTYGWVDKDKGVVRVPIEKAMEMIAKEGLPTRRMAGGRRILL